MLIMQVYHDSGRMRGFARMSDSGRILTPVALLDSGRRPNFGRLS
jgi:hypothetical protein